MGWIGTAFLVLGRYYIGQMVSNGLFYTFVGDFLWMIVGIRKRITSLAFTGGLMALLDLIGWFMWPGT